MLLRLLVVDVSNPDAFHDCPPSSAAGGLREAEPTSPTSPTSPNEKRALQELDAHGIGREEN